MPRRNLAQLYRDEFRGYTPVKFQQDALAGLTVAAVALPLALAFGVASGATASAGLVTAIIAGFLMGALAGAPYQISGPTGAMSAVLIMLVQKYGLNGIWIAGFMAGIFLTVIGLLRLGRFIAFIPSPVITGFTSGIALIIFIGQIDNFLGIHSGDFDSAALKFINYFKGGFSPEWHSLVIGSLVILTMLFFPKKWNAKFPASLVGILLATGLNFILKWPVAVIGEIPRSLLLAEHFNPLTIPWSQVENFLGPALTITALGAIESLLCGAVGSNMTGIRLQANQELIAQGVGNMVIPFFGGVPVSAAIARASVGIKSGGHTRLVSIFHAVGLLLSMFLLSPVMARIPLAALAGVLMVTAWRMNEWDGIHFMFSHNDTYIGNIFEKNESGVAVMYTKKVHMYNNFFLDNWGGAAYGILLKDITDSDISGNHFSHNTTAIEIEGCSRNNIYKNIFNNNGWAMRISASSMDNKIYQNNFMSNTFDVATNGTLVLNTFDGNYWDKYEGYDLNRDGVGDVPYRPVSLYSMIIQSNPASLMLFRSIIVALLDKTEKLLPGITPENLKDDRPMIKPLPL
jgi:parallel beta-helix repeat protein